MNMTCVYWPLWKVHLFNCLLAQISSQLVTCQQLSLMKFQLSIIIGTKDDLSHFDMFADAR